MSARDAHKATLELGRIIQGECIGSIPGREVILFGSVGCVRVMKRVSFVIYVGKRKGMWVMM
jgi:hypothetical protein